MGRKSREKRDRATKQPRASEPVTSDSRPVPRGWGGDSLSQFLQIAHENAFSVFTDHRRVFNLVGAIHETFDAVLGLATHTSPKYLSFFVARAHSAYLAAVRLALVGQVSESFAPLRVCIETAWYGLHVSADPGDTKRMEAWLCRDDSDEAKWNVVKMFKSGDIKATHHARDPETAAILEQLYERCISFGAHPNPGAFLTNTIREQDERTVTHKLLYLNPQVQPLMFALKSGIEAAIGVLRVFGLMYSQAYVASGMINQLAALIDELNAAFCPVCPLRRLTTASSCRRAVCHTRG